MEILAYILVIGGLLVMVAGIALLFKKPPATVTGGRPEALPDIGDYLEKIKELLEVLDKHARTGIAVMFFGLTLVVLGLFVADRETRDAVEDGATSPAALVRVV